MKRTDVTRSALAISPDGTYVVAVETPTTYHKTNVNIWETDTWREATSLTIATPTPIACLVFTPDGKYLLAGSVLIKFLRVGSWQEVLTLSSHGEVFPLVVTPDGKHIIAGTNVWKIDLSLVDH